MYRIETVCIDIRYWYCIYSTVPCGLYVDNKHTVCTRLYSLFVLFLFPIWGDNLNFPQQVPFPNGIRVVSGSLYIYILYAWYSCSQSFRFILPTGTYCTCMQSTSIRVMHAHWFFGKIKYLMGSSSNVCYFALESVSHGVESCLDGRPKLKALKLETNGMLAFFCHQTFGGNPEECQGNGTQITGCW